MDVTMKKVTGRNTLAIVLKAPDSTSKQQDALIETIAALIDAFQATGKATS